MRIGNVRRVVIEGRQRADAADHDRHRMRVAAKALIEPRHLLVDHGVVGDGAVEIQLLRRGWKLAIQQEIAALQEIAVLGELLDWIAAIEQDAFVAVDKRDLRLAARGRGVAWIVGENAGLVVQLTDVDDIGARRSFIQRQIVVLVADDQGTGLRARLRIHGILDW